MGKKFRRDLVKIMKLPKTWIDETKKRRSHRSMLRLGILKGRQRYSWAGDTHTPSL